MGPAVSMANVAFTVTRAHDGSLASILIIVPPSFPAHPDGFGLFAFSFAEQESREVVAGV